MNYVRVVIELRLRWRTANVRLDRVVGLVEAVVDIQIQFLLEGQREISLLFAGVLLIAMIVYDAVADHQTQLTGAILVASDILLADLNQLRFVLTQWQWQERFAAAWQLLGNGAGLCWCCASVARLWWPLSAYTQVAQIAKLSQIAQLSQISEVDST